MSFQPSQPSMPPESLPDRSVSTVDVTEPIEPQNWFKSQLTYWGFAWQEFQLTKGYRWMKASGKLVTAILFTILGLGVWQIVSWLLPLLPKLAWLSITLGVVVIAQALAIHFLGRFHERKVKELDSKITTNTEAYNEERANIIASFKEQLGEKVKLGRPKLTGSFQHFIAHYWTKRDVREKGKDVKDEQGHVNIMLPVGATGTLIVVYVRFVNDNPTPTTLHNYSLTLEVGDKKFIAMYPEELPEPPPPWMPPEVLAEEAAKRATALVSYLDDPSKPAIQGRGIQGFITFYFDGFMWQEFKEQDWFFTLSITDAWDEEHKIAHWGKPPRQRQRNI